MIKKVFVLSITILLFIAQVQLSFGQTTITMQREGGVFTVPCTVNGLKLKFIFDTGASDVSISLTEALFMLKNGYLDSKDIIGKGYYTDATGSISVGTKIILRKIEFFGLTLYDVQASVVHELSAPLLLGQSAMAKLGTFQIDPNNGTLTILNGPNNSNNNGNYSSSNGNINARPVNNKPPSSNNSSPPDSHNNDTPPNSSNNGSPPILTGTVKVYEGSPIYNKPCMAPCEQVGVAGEVVTIIRKHNENYYYVTAGGIVYGFLHVGWIKAN